MITTGYYKNTRGKVIFVMGSAQHEGMHIIIYKDLEYNQKYSMGLNAFESMIKNFELIEKVEVKAS